MSYSGGVFSINSTGQPVVSGTTISASVFNALTSDLATGLSTCMLKDGTQTATAGIGFYAGTVSLPGIYFGTDTATGLYRIGLNNTGYSINGTKLLDLSAALFAVTGAATVSTTLGVTGATTLTGGLVLPGTAANITLGSNYISYGGTDAGLSFDGSNDATFSGAVLISGAYAKIGTASQASSSLYIQSTSAGEGLIRFQDAASVSQGIITYDQNASSMSLATGGVTRMTLTSAGINGVLGGTTPAAATVTTLAASGAIKATGTLPVIQIGPDSPSTNDYGRLKFLTSNTQYNWQISNNAVVTAGSLEFTPSTATGGTTFTTPAVTITNAAVYLTAVGTTASAANAYIDNASSPTNSILRSTSSLAYKTDVEPLSADYANKVLQLSPIWYRSLAAADRKDWSWFGLGAEDVAKIEPRLVSWTYPVIGQEEAESKDGGKYMKPIFGKELVPDGVQYERISVLLLDVVKRMEQRIAKLENA